MAVNQEPSLRRSLGTSKQRTDGEEEGQVEEQVEEEAEGEEATGKGKGRATKEGRAKKSKSEALRRNAECYHLESICFLFKASRKGWTRKDALSLGEPISLSMDATSHLPISSQPFCSSSTAPPHSPPVSLSFTPPHRGCRLERTLFFSYLNSDLPSDFTGHLFWSRLVEKNTLVSI